MGKNLDIIIEKRELSSLTPLSKNAHYMDKREFDQLVSNIKNDGCLTSLPVVYDADVPGEILSGNHRVKAAIQAGLTEADVIVIRSTLSKQQKIAIQLSHNAIHGKDDPNLLEQLFSELTDIDFKEYSGLTDDCFKVSEVELTPLTFAKPEMENLSLVFLKSDKKIFDEHREEIEKLAKKNDVWLANIDDFDVFYKSIFNIKTEHVIINASLAIKVMAELALEKLKEKIGE